jgi:hypothetical protein
MAAHAGLAVAGNDPALVLDDFHIKYVWGLV